MSPETRLFDEQEVRNAVIVDLITMQRDPELITGPELDNFLRMKREEKSRIISADSLADEGKCRMLLGAEREEGLTMPWAKAEGRVLIREGKLIIWSGWTFHGKSAMCKQVMVSAIHQGYKVCIASMEEEIREVWADMGYVALGKHNPGVKDADAWVKYCSGKLWFYDQQGRTKPERIKVVIQYAAEKLGVRHFVLDSLMLVALGKDDYEAQASFCCR